MSEPPSSMTTDLPNGAHEIDPPPADIPSLPEVCADLHARVQAFLAREPSTDLLRRVQEQTRISLEVTRKALSDYDIHDLSLSYNGGKDCLVLLVLFLATLHTHHFTTQSSPSSQQNQKDKITTIPSIYAPSPHPFPTVESFVHSSASQYHLSLHRIPTGPHSPTPTILDAFTTYLVLNPNTKAIFVGTRRTDPHGGNLTHFDMTDHGWPVFMRVHPVIDWRLAEIWGFIREVGVGYCGLYDEGYTSLGGRDDTWRNPRLKRREEEGGGFRPAYEMEEDAEERAGREGREGRGDVTLR